MFEYIIKHFNEHIDLCSRNIEHLTPNIEQAATTICDTMLQQGKIFCLGANGSQTVARQFCYYMQHDFEYERPALPCIDISAINPAQLNSNFSALAQANDTLLMFDHPRGDIDIKQTIQNCNNLNIKTVICSHRGIHSSDDNIFLNVQIEKDFNILEIQFLIMHILCKVIDRQLFGYEASS